MRKDSGAEAKLARSGRATRWVNCWVLMNERTERECAPYNGIRRLTPGPSGGRCASSWTERGVGEGVIPSVSGQRHKERNVTARADGNGIRQRPAGHRSPPYNGERSRQKATAFMNGILGLEADN